MRRQRGYRRGFVQQMVEHGVLLFPLENGSAPMYKPPLFHWTATALDRIARVNRVTAFNLRLPSALYAIAGVVLTIIFAWAPLGESGAIAGRADSGRLIPVRERRTSRAGRYDADFFRDARDDELSLDFTDRVRSFDCWR